MVRGEEVQTLGERRLEVLADPTAALSRTGFAEPIMAAVASDAVSGLLVLRRQDPGTGAACIPGVETPLRDLCSYESGAETGPAETPE